MPRLVILNAEDLQYDDYQNVVGIDYWISLMYYGTYREAGRSLSRIKTMEGDYVFLF